jgi:hypothetical protein
VRSALLAPFRGERLAVAGDFRTGRRVIALAGFPRECDESGIPDRSAFWEIEVETEDPDAAREAVTAKLAGS